MAKKIRGAMPLCFYEGPVSFFFRSCPKSEVQTGTQVGFSLEVRTQHIRRLPYESSAHKKHLPALQAPSTNPKDNSHMANN